MPAVRTTPTKKRAGPPSKSAEVCTICGKVVSRATDIPRHMKIHNPTKKFLCPWDGCDFSTSYKSNLETHHRTKHTGEKPFHCSECNYQTGDQSLLNKHRKKHKMGESSSGSAASASTSSTPTLPSCDWDDSSNIIQQSPPSHDFFAEMTPFLPPALPRAMTPTNDSFPTMSQLLEMGSFDFLDEEPDMEPGEN